PPLA
ncbi:hypothetical protein BN1723_020024, partial [Verticillium longisporum]